MGGQGAVFQNHHNYNPPAEWAVNVMECGLPGPPLEWGDLTRPIFAHFLLPICPSVNCFPKVMSPKLMGNLTLKN